MANFRTEVHNKDVADEIGRRIEDGIEDAADKIGDGITRTAKAKIRREKAVFRKELLHGFKTAKVEFGDSTSVSVQNLSDHAPYQERGVSGIVKKRDTPYSYKGKKPPIASLLPWVKENLMGAGFDKQRTRILDSRDRRRGDRDGDDPAPGVGDDGDGPDPPHDPLMGADELEVGTEVTFNKPDYGVGEGRITKVADELSGEYDWDYEVEVEGGFLPVNFEDISRWNGKGADPGDVSLGTDVYVGELDKFGRVKQILTDPDTGDPVGAQVVFVDDDVGEALDFPEFEVSKIDDPFDRNGPIIRDSNGLYVEEPGYIAHDMNDMFSNLDMFPGQKLVVYNTKLNKYNRATVLDFPSSDDDNIKFEEDIVGGGTFTVSDGNVDENRIVGYEDFDELPESEIKQRLREHFDKNIRGAEQEEVLKHSFAQQEGLIAPDSDRLDWVRDKWTTDIWDLYHDKWYVKEQLRNLEAIVDYEDAKVQKGYAGGVGPYDGKSRFIAIFLSKAKLQNYQNTSEAEYLDTLKHEVSHATSASNRYAYVGKKAYGEHVKNFAKFDRDGNELTGATASPSGDPIQLPQDAKLQMFHDDIDVSSGPIGGTTWMGDAYDAAKQGVTGIESYTPTFRHGKDEPLARLHEAGNKAYWLQAVEVTERGGNVGTKDDVFVLWDYSITNADETLATLNEVLSSVEEDYENRIRRMDELYPWLIEAWLGVYIPPENVEEILKDLGYNL